MEKGVFNMRHHKHFPSQKEADDFVKDKQSPVVKPLAATKKKEAKPKEVKPEEDK
ncbi:MAG: hypothetical protein ACYS1A_19545 [Planctomycetota bacterium]|jgi:hypothetical protein